MKLLLVSDHYPPAVGGAERQTQLLAATLAAAGNEVSVAVPWVKGLPELHDDGGVAVHRIRQTRTLAPLLVRGDAHRHAPPYPDPIMAWRLRRIIRRLRPDIVHSHGWITYSVAAALLGSRIQLVISVRDYGYFCANRTLLRDELPCRGPRLGKCLGCSGRYYGRPKGWLSAIGVFVSAPLLRRKVRGIASDSRFVARTMQDHFLKNGHAPRALVDV